jgi:hypothetical protein
VGLQEIGQVTRIQEIEKNEYLRRKGKQKVSEDEEDI